MSKRYFAVARRPIALLLVALSLAAPLAAQAKTPQQFAASIEGKSFESDDDGILYLIPIKGTFNLMASTKGAAAYPPPKTPVDRFSITCRHFDGKPVKYIAKDFGSNGCEVRFEKGVSKTPFGDPAAQYEAIDGNNSIEITAVKGKVIEGKFSLDLKDKKTKARLVISNGSFIAEDRQQ